MGYLNGIRTHKLVHEMTPFEQQLAILDKKARAYHQKKEADAAIKGETPAERIARERDRKSELDHLNHEIRHAQSIGTVQFQLDAYRESVRYKAKDSDEVLDAKDLLMSRERHHPANILGNYLRADGRPKPSPKHTAHHIVPGKGKTRFAAQARVAMHLLSVRINDPHNGAWMIMYKKDEGHWSMPKAKSHLQIHTHNYERWVFDKLNRSAGETGIRASLVLLRKLLESGKQPDWVTMPPIRG